MSTYDPLSEDFQLRALMENTEDSIYFKDRECRLLRVSRRMADSLGFSDVSELVGKTDIDLFGEAFGQRTRMEDLRIMESDEPIVGLVESRHVGPGPSSTNWTLTTKVPLHDGSGKVVGLLGITREINELKRTELDLLPGSRHGQEQGDVDGHCDGRPDCPGRGERHGVYRLRHPDHRAGTDQRQAR